MLEASATRTSRTKLAERTRADLHRAIRFWADRLPASRKGTRWDQIVQVLAVYRLIAPGSEWRLHRQWFANSAMGTT